MSGLIGQAAARIIVGPELCRNKEYHAITLSYTMSRGRALAAIHAWPRALHPLIHWFLPSCRNVRTQIRRAEKLITPILERTRRARARGDPPQAFSTLAWSDEYARAQGRSYNATLAQMRFTSSSIHNTSDLLGKVMLRICQRPDLIEPLRREIVAGFDGGSGAQHHSLGKLKLMESVMKETQRLEPAAERVSYPEHTKTLKTDRLLYSKHVPRCQRNSHPLRRDHDPQRDDLRFLISKPLRPLHVSRPRDLRSVSVHENATGPCPGESRFVHQDQEHSFVVWAREARLPGSVYGERHDQARSEPYPAEI